MTGQDLLGVSFRVIGLALTAIAAVAGAFTLVFVLRSQELIGEVVALSRIQNQITVMPSSTETGVLHYPVISYTTPAGIQREFTGPRGRVTPRHRVGDTVSVLVSRSDPADARLNTTLGVWGTPIVVGGLAVIFFILSVAAPFGFGGMRRR